jgi:hypothetical protein
MKNKILFLLLLTLISLLMATYIYTKHQQEVVSTSKIIIIPSFITSSITPLPTINNVLGLRLKKIGCVLNQSLPDKECTPGDTFTGVTKETICQPGYTKTVRNVSEKLKREVFAEYGIEINNRKDYEVDHLISLELGGSNDISNLWPEPALPRPGFHEKDRVENYLHKAICDGKIDLEKAQNEVANDWVSIYLMIIK